MAAPHPHEPMEACAASRAVEVLELFDVEHPTRTLRELVARPLVRAGEGQRIDDALRDREPVQGGRHPLRSAAIVDARSVQGADTEMAFGCWPRCVHSSRQSAWSGRAAANPDG